MKQFVDKPFEHVKREMVRPNLVVLAITSLTAYHCGFQKLGTVIPSLTRDFLQLGTEGSADHHYSKNDYLLAVYFGLPRGD